jgi:hypothetical protein
MYLSYILYLVSKKEDSPGQEQEQEQEQEVRRLRNPEHVCHARVKTTGGHANQGVIQGLDDVIISPFTCAGSRHSGTMASGPWLRGG